MNAKEYREHYSQKSELRAWFDVTFPGSLEKVDAQISEEMAQQAILDHATSIDKDYVWGKLPQRSLLEFMPIEALNNLQYMIDKVPDKYYGKGLKPKMIATDKFLQQYGFYPAGKGTSRSAYYHINDNSVILKLGRDTQGKRDNIREYWLQYAIRPNCAKVYDCLPDGLLQLCERAVVCNMDLFAKNFDKIFYIIKVAKKLGFWMDDVGGRFFMNWAIRPNYGPIIIDFAEIYEVDPAKLICRIPNMKGGGYCGGKIDYDYSGTAMSQIICKKCGERYLAADLAKSTANFLRENNYGIIQGNRDDPLSEHVHFQIREGNDIIYSSMSEVVNN